MQPDIQEALRYLGPGASSDPQSIQLATQLSQLLSDALQPRWVWKLCPLERCQGCFVLGGTDIVLSGHTAQLMLSDCHQAALLCCTLGQGFEALLRREQARDMARAVVLNACGSSFVEVGCDKAEEELAQRLPDLYRTDRFSPGYGDLPLTLQSPLCSLLDVQRRLGVTVTPSSLLNPSKSVTAIIGLSHRPQMARVRGCGYCAMKDTCPLRKGGKRCGL